MAENENKVTEEVTENNEAVATKAEEKQAVKEQKTAKEKKASEKAAAKKNKVSLGKKIKKGFKEFKAEFKKIVWSSKRATFTNTVLVVVVMVIVAVVIGLLDTGFSNLLSWIGSLV